MLIGACGQPRLFTAPVLAAMARWNERPIVFALSNPTSKSECTAEEAYEHTSGRAVFASGSPFPPVRAFGREYRPGQCNNAYIFPGLGLGAVLSGARHLSSAVFAAAAHTLAGLVGADELATGCIYPAIGRIREVSARIAAAVIHQVRAEGTTPDRCLAESGGRSASRNVSARLWKVRPLTRACLGVLRATRCRGSTPRRLSGEGHLAGPAQPRIAPATCIAWPAGRRKGS